jgi:hypothetical protein
MIGKSLLIFFDGNQVCYEALSSVQVVRDSHLPPAIYIGGYLCPERVDLH